MAESTKEFNGDISGYETCTSTKLLGSLYLPYSDLMLVQSALNDDGLFQTLDIKALENDDENPAPDGFSIELCREKPVFETSKGGKLSIQLASVPSLVHKLATGGIATGILNIVLIYDRP